MQRTTRKIVYVEYPRRRFPSPLFYKACSLAHQRLEDGALNSTRVGEVSGTCVPGVPLSVSRAPRLQHGQEHWRTLQAVVQTAVDRSPMGERFLN